MILYIAEVPRDVKLNLSIGLRFYLGKENRVEPELVKIFKALGNETRLAIFDYIRSTEYDCTSGGEEECSVNTTCRTVRVSHISRKFSTMGTAAISQHLKTLHQAGVLKRHKAGPWVYYTIATETLLKLHDYFLPLLHTERSCFSFREELPAPQ